MLVSLGHLSRLQQLQLTVNGTPAAGSCLPPALTALSLLCVCGEDGREDPGAAHVAHLHIAGLGQLQKLQLTGECMACLFGFFNPCFDPVA